MPYSVLLKHVKKRNQKHVNNWQKNKRSLNLINKFKAKYIKMLEYIHLFEL